MRTISLLATAADPTETHAFSAESRRSLRRRLPHQLVSSAGSPSLLPRRAPEGPPLPSDPIGADWLALRARCGSSKPSVMSCGRILPHPRLGEDLPLPDRAGRGARRKPRAGAAAEAWSVRRAATIAALVGAPWLLVGSGIAVGIAVG